MVLRLARNSRNTPVTTTNAPAIKTYRGMTATTGSPGAGKAAVGVNVGVGVGTGMDKH